MVYFPLLHLHLLLSGNIDSLTYIGVILNTILPFKGERTCPYGFDSFLLATVFAVIFRDRASEVNAIHLRL